jgi:simple sugar transport system substrate-binding protein
MPNPFFTPTQYGMADAAKLLGLPTPKWGGSNNSVISDMTSYFQEAVAAKADGIATSVISATAFTAPIKSAMEGGIPVISYNSDGVYANGKPEIGTNRLCYVGQSLYVSGQSMGEQIKQLVPGGGEIVIFIATPGTGNIQPRADGAVSVLGSNYTVHQQQTGAETAQEPPAERAYLLAHKNIKGAFAVDAGSTEVLGDQLKTAGLNVPSGGFDTLGNTVSNIKSGLMDFTIYQDPYLQGFMPVLYLYLFKVSGGALSPPDTDTGLSVVTKDNVAAYAAPSRYQGTSTSPKYIPLSGAINAPAATTST